MKKIKKSRSNPYFGEKKERPHSTHIEPPKEYKAFCSECKTRCELPFDPIKGATVYCRECYAKRRAKSTGRRRKTFCTK